MNDAISTALGLCALLVVACVVVSDVVSTQRLDAAYEASQPVTVRNEWGQLRHTPEFMCEASIRQWLKECGK